MASASPAADPRMMNLQARSLVTSNAVRMVQQIHSSSFDPDTNPTLNIPTRNVGLLLGFIVEVTGGVTNGAADVATRTGFGSANAVKNFTFTDLNNVQRINTSGRHMALLNSSRTGAGCFGGAYASNLPMGFGNNWAPFAASSTLAADAAGTVTHTYHVPVAYSPDDLTGAIYAAIVNATMNLGITVASSAEIGVAAAGDPLNAIYSGNDNLAWTGNVTVTVYQVYYDQLPMMNGGPVLPGIDLNTIYDIKQTSVNGLATGQDFPIPYANFRKFLSTFAIYDNAGVYNVGSDINYFAMQAANQTQLFKVSPNIAALEARQVFMADPPAGCYYFDHRRKPIDTITYGNMELVINPAAVTAGAQVIMGYEAFNTVNMGAAGSSLPGA